jgi:hypothetical protein
LSLEGTDNDLFEVEETPLFQHALAKYRHESPRLIESYWERRWFWSRYPRLVGTAYSSLPDIAGREFYLETTAPLFGNAGYRWLYEVVGENRVIAHLISRA